MRSDIDLAVDAERDIDDRDSALDILNRKRPQMLNALRTILASILIASTATAQFDCTTSDVQPPPIEDCDEGTSRDPDAVAACWITWGNDIAAARATRCADGTAAYAAWRIAQQAADAARAAAFASAERYYRQEVALCNDTYEEGSPELGACLLAADTARQKAKADAEKAWAEAYVQAYTQRVNDVAAAEAAYAAAIAQANIELQACVEAIPCEGD